MVKGMTRELFYGTAESPGLVRCLTVFGEGRININTAPPPVLLALAEEMRTDDVERLIEYRRDLRNDLSSPAWHQQITQPAGINMPTALIVVKSDVFQITAIGFQGQMEERVTAIVRRGADRRKVGLLSWKVT
jgi:general secretion pathway protein K